MQLYDSFYINFSSSIPRSLLEEFATLTLEANSAHLVSQVYDQYLNYVCLESNLFSLQLNNSYFLIHDANSAEAMLEDLTASIASSLFSVILTLGNLSFFLMYRRYSHHSMSQRICG
jgi:hypothetical protein